MMLASIIFLVGPSIVSAQSPSVPDPKQLEEIQRLEAEWNRANELSDPDAKVQLLADDSYHVGPSGRLYDKTADIVAAREARARRLAGSEVKFDVNPQIRMFDGVAVVTGSGRSTTTENGRRRVGNLFRFVHVWVKRDGRWRLIVDQVTGVAQAAPPVRVVTEEAEYVAARYNDALKAKDWIAAARMMHPDAHRKLASLLEPLIAAKLIEIGRNYFGLNTRSDFYLLREEEIFARLMDSLTRRTVDATPAIWAVAASPLGKLNEKPDVVHIVYRVHDRPKSVVSGEVMVRTLKLHENSWKVMLPNQLEGVIAAWSDVTRPSVTDIDKMEIEP